MAIFLQFLGIEPRFVRKGCSAKVRSQSYPEICALALISCQRVAPGEVRHKLNCIFVSVFEDRPSFRAKGFSRTSPAQVKKLQYNLSLWRSTVILFERFALPQLKFHFYFSFRRSTLIFCESFAPAQVTCNFTSAFGHRPHFIRKGDISWLPASTDKEGDREKRKERG